MEIVLGALADWLHRSFRSKPLRWTAAITVLGFGFLLALTEWYRGVETETTNIEIGAGLDWDWFCVSSQYEIPDISLDRTIGIQCWDGNEVPHNKLFITYRLVSGQCKGQVLTGDFLESGLSETRCYARPDVVGKSLVKQDGVYFIQDPRREND